MALIVAICFASTCGALLHILFCVLLSLEANLYCVFSTLLVVPMLLLVKCDHFELAAHILLGAGWLLTTLLVLGTGGASSPMAVHLLVPMIAAGALLRMDGLKLWGPATLGSCLATLVLSMDVIEAALRPYVSIGEAGLHIGLLISVMEVCGLVWFYEAARQRREAILREQIAMVKQSNIALETSRRKSEAAQCVAEQAGNARTSFLATMSHEIRTPLSGTLGALQLLSNSELNAEQQKLVHIAQRSGKSLLSLISDILDLVKFDSGQVPLELVPISPRDLLLDAQSILCEKARSRNNILKCDFDSILPERLIGDPTRTQQILLNLLGNAVKFTSHGQITARAAYASGCLVLEVADTGIGMSNETITRLFTPFMQADGSTTRRFGGTGLGLAITDRLVTVMGGRIEVCSVEGVGTTFTVNLPMPLAEPNSADPSSDQAAPVIFPTGLHILLAEDDPINLFVARCMFQRLGCTVSVASDGQKAAAVALSGQYDAIFMDVHMPNVDGLTATRRIRQHEEPLRHRNIIIGLSADAMLMEQQDGIAAGMDAYLTKPIEENVLLDILVKVARTRRQEQPQDVLSLTAV